MPVVMKRLGMIGLLVMSAAATAGAQQPPAAKDPIPAEFKPPKGMCRIWLQDVPPKQQPAPTDCAAAVKNVPKNGRVIFGDTGEKKGKDSLPAGAKSLTGKGTPPILIKKKPPLGG
jgi:hypothetical protein